MFKRICFSSQTLCDDLEGDTHGDFEDVLVALITPPAKFDCQEFMRAIKVHNLVSFLTANSLNVFILNCH